MGDPTREKTIEELEEELKEASEEYKRLSSLVKQKKDAEEKERNKKIEAVKKDRAATIEKMLTDVDNEIKKYLEDYGTSRINKIFYYLNYIFNGKSPIWFWKWRAC